MFIQTDASAVPVKPLIPVVVTSYDDGSVSSGALDLFSYWLEFGA
jgi:hypothetical protein